MNDLLATLNTDLNLQLVEIYTKEGAASEDLADYATETGQFVGLYYLGNKVYFFIVEEFETTRAFLIS
jgi:hypothetical protein